MSISQLKLVTVFIGILYFSFKLRFWPAFVRDSLSFIRFIFWTKSSAGWWTVKKFFLFLLIRYSLSCSKSCTCFNWVFLVFFGSSRSFSVWLFSLACEFKVNSWKACLYVWLESVGSFVKPISSSSFQGSSSFYFLLFDFMQTLYFYVSCFNSWL